MITLTAVAALALGAQTPSINQYVQRNLDDATFRARVVKADQRELLKINKDFGQSYRFETTTIKFKEPLKVRLEASVEDTNVLYIIDGATQIIKIPRIKVNQRVDLSKSPGRRQTTLDFGILTPALFNGLFVAKFVRNDRATGDVVFDLTYQASLDDTSRHRIWIDSDKKIVTKREWYNQHGRQLATFVYENPQQESGVWVPSKLTVRNTDNKVAGITSYTDIKINTGLNDSIFKG
ncbi:MAG: outer membrane lipoprotein-sorting protein [Fimbriimonas sp.]